MVIGAKSLRFAGIVALAISIILPTCLAASADSVNPIQALSKNFPNSIRIETDDRLSIEFCPDNTCEIFISNKKTFIDKLRDFTYVYLYFFSTYYILEEWRKGEEPTNIARRILSKIPYQDCRREAEHETARCLLLRLSREGRIKMYFVRYDEGQRNVVEQDILEKALNPSRRGRR